MALGAGSPSSAGASGEGGVVGQDRGYFETGREKFSWMRDSLRAWRRVGLVDPEAAGEPGGL